MESCATISLPWLPIDGITPTNALDSVADTSCRFFGREQLAVSVVDAKKRRVALEEKRAWMALQLVRYG